MFFFWLLVASNYLTRYFHFNKMRLYIKKISFQLGVFDHIMDKDKLKGFKNINFNTVQDKIHY